MRLTSPCPSSSHDAGVLLAGCLEALGLSRTAARLHVHAPFSRPAAWFEEETVHLRPPLQDRGFWSAGGLGPLMVAHEAVHAAQRSADLPRAPVVALEHEADVLARRLVTGEPCRVRLGGGPGRRHWGRGGHYYTTYLAGLVAGADPSTAQRMAFYCQVPDLVSELDATTQVATRLELMDMDGETPVGWYVGPNRGVRPADPEVCLDVIEGLHALTGAGVADERRRRRAILMNAGWGSLRFGIALHAFGDAYAHAFRSTMFGHDYGHAKLAHLPDEVSVHQQTYFDYYDDLLSVLTSKVAPVDTTRAPDAPTPEQVKLALRYMVIGLRDGDDEPNQIPFMQRLIGRMTTPSARVANPPANACIPWADFIKTAPAATLPMGDPEDGNDFAKILSTILGYGRAWRFTRPDPRTLDARMKEVDAKRKAEAQIAQQRTQAWSEAARLP